MKFFRLCFLSFTLLLTTHMSPARGQSTSTPAAPDVTNKPILQIDPGGHTAGVGRVLFTPDGKELVSVGWDKVIRFWDVASGDITRQLRGQIGPGPEGSMYAAAISPDGKILAAGGYFDAIDSPPIGPIRVFPRIGAIRLFDIASGQVTRSLERHDDIITALAFSPDGATLASVGADWKVVLWDVASGEDRRTLPGHTKRVHDVAWSPDGKKLAAAGADGAIRLWEVETGKALRVLQHDTEVLCAAWSSDGKTVASGSQDQIIRLWNADTGALIRALPPQNNLVSSLAFSPDGRRLVSALGGRTAALTVRVWSMPDCKMLREFTAHDNSVMSVAYAFDNRTVASAGGNHNDIYLWDAESGAIKKHLRGVGLSTYDVAWSQDGERVAWGTSNVDGNANAPRPLERSFNLAGVAPGKDVTGDEKWRRVVTEQNGRRLTLSDDKLNVILQDGKREISRLRNSQGHDQIRSYSFARGGVVIGSTFSLRQHDENGQFLKDFVGHTGEVWAIAVSPDGRTLASAGNDQTVRLWSLEDPLRSRIGIIFDEKTECLISFVPKDQAAALAGVKAGDMIEAIDDVAVKTTDQAAAVISAKAPRQRIIMRVRRKDEVLKIPIVTIPVWIEVKPLLSIFMGRDREWVAWTPQGYYACSPKAERVIGWQVNRGFDKAADYYPAYQFRKQFYRPDVMAKIIETGSVEKALQLADAARKQKTDLQLVAGNIEKFAPPRVEILAPDNGSTLPAATATVKARITDPNGRPIKAVNLLVNGRDSKAIAIGDRSIAIGDKSIAIGDRPIAVSDKPLPGGDWEESVTLVPGENTLSVVAINDAGAESLPANIKITSRGVQQKPDLYLLSVGVSKYQDEKYSLAYAAKDAIDFASAMQAQQSKRFGKVLGRTLTDDKAGKAAILNGLEWLKKQVKQDDWAILFLSGHGFKNKNEYVFAPHDIDPDLLELTGLSWSDLRDGLRLPGRVLLVLDTCRAGGAGGGLAYNDTLREARDNGLITLASCLPNEVSKENKEWSNGAFTKALVEALQGKADSDNDGTVTLGETDGYISNRVKELTNDGQHPSSPRPTGVPSGLALTLLK